MITRMATRSSPPSDLWGSVPGASERNEQGAFVRPKTVFRHWVRMSRAREFPAEPGRYHLYVSLGCPWASRTVTVRALKGLEDVVGLSVVDPIRDDRGWAFRDAPGATGDPINGLEYLSEAYERVAAGLRRTRQRSGPVGPRDAGRSSTTSPPRSS